MRVLHTVWLSWCTQSGVHPQAKVQGHEHNTPLPASTWLLMTLDGPATHSLWIEQKRLLCAWGGVWAGGEGASVPFRLCCQFAHPRSGRDAGQ